MDYLGYKVGIGGVRVNQNKLRLIQNWPAPENRTMVKRWLGATGYFRKMLPLYSKIVTPITNLLKKNVEFHWSEKCNDIYHSVNNMLAHAPILALPDINKDFQIFTDYSGDSVAAVLCQDGRPVHFISHKLSDTQSRWSPLQGEFFGVHFALQKFRPWIFGGTKRIDLYTDHRPIIYWQTAKYNDNRLISRWIMEFSQYNLHIHYLEGSRNSLADFCSRLNWPNHFDPSEPDSRFKYCQNCESFKDVRDHSCFIISSESAQKYSSSVDNNHSDHHLGQNINDTSHSSECQNDTLHQTSKKLQTSSSHAAQNVTNIESHVHDSTKQQRSYQGMYCKSKGLNVINTSRLVIPGKSLAAQYRSLLQSNIKPSQNTDSKTASNLDLPTHDFSHDLLITEQGKDTELSEIISALQNPSEDKKYKNKFILVDKVLYYISQGEDKALRLVIPSSLVESVLQGFHEENMHIGSQRCYDLLARSYYFLNMYAKVQQHCLVDCDICRQYNIKPDILPLQTSLKATAPFQILSWDVTGPYIESFSHNRYVVTMLDQYSNWVEGWAVPSVEADVISHLFLTKWWPRYGCPLIVTTDQGSSFCNSKLTNLFKELSISQVTTSSYHPCSNKVERWHRWLKTSLTKSLVNSDHRNWDTFLGNILAAYRFSPHSSRKFSPFFMLTGQDPHMPLDNMLQPRRRYHGSDHSSIFLENMAKTFSIANRRVQKIQKYNEAKRMKHVTRNAPFSVNDPVFLSRSRLPGQPSTKWSMKWLPHYRIIAKRGPDSYSIRNSLTGQVLHVHGQYLKLSQFDWPKPSKQPENQRPRRSCTFVNPPGSESDTDCESVISSDNTSVISSDNTSVMSDDSIASISDVSVSISDGELHSGDNSENSELQQNPVVSPSVSQDTAPTDMSTQNIGHSDTAEQPQVVKQKRKRRVYTANRSPVQTRSKSTRLVSQEIHRAHSASNENDVHLETDSNLIRNDSTDQISPVKSTASDSLEQTSPVKTNMSDSEFENISLSGSENGSTHEDVFLSSVKTSNNAKDEKLLQLLHSIKNLMK